MTVVKPREVVDQMTAEQMRDTLHRLLDRCDAAEAHGDSIPADRTLIVRTASGGCQDMPETEQVFMRADLPEDPANPEWNERRFWPVGGVTADNTDPDRRWSLGELLWLDDPECDRGDVSLEAFLSTDAITDVVCGLGGDGR